MHGYSCESSSAFKHVASLEGGTAYARYGGCRRRRIVCDSAIQVVYDRHYDVIGACLSEFQGVMMSTALARVRAYVHVLVSLLTCIQCTCMRAC